MRRRVVVGTFATDEDLLGAARAARESGFRIVDAYTPYPVHGLAGAMGLRPSRLPWLCFGLFFTFFLLFCRFLPMIAMAEIKGVLGYGHAETGHDAAGAEAHPPHAPALSQMRG